MKINRSLAVALGRGATGIQAESSLAARPPRRSPLPSALLVPAPNAHRAMSRIAFTDPVAYDSMTGAWSDLVADPFIDWLNPAPKQRWLEVGSGTGRFARRVVNRCAPAIVHGIDPEAAQVEHARRQADPRVSQFMVGDAMNLPYPAASFDIAVMPLVLVFLHDPARGVSQMARVLAPGGQACAYNWDLEGRGSPLAPLGLAMRQAGVPALSAPSEHVSSEPAVRALWIAAGLKDVQTHAITVQRRFDSFEQAWAISQLGASTGDVIRSLRPEKRDEVQARFRDNLQQDTSGPVTWLAKAIAVRGTVVRQDEG